MLEQEYYNLHSCARDPGAVGVPTEGVPAAVFVQETLSPLVAELPPVQSTLRHSQLAALHRLFHISILLVVQGFSTPHNQTVFISLMKAASPTTLWSSFALSCVV